MILIRALTFLSENATKQANQAMKKLDKNMIAVILSEVDQRHGKNTTTASSRSQLPGRFENMQVVFTFSV